MGATQTVGWIRSHGRKATAFALFALVLLTALAVASSSKAAVESPPPPSVWSDKADYAPGEFVMLSGANWSPGEAVHIRVNDDAGETWRRDVDVTADESGVISDQFNLPDWFVATYTVTATGATSGTATWSFTDANYRFLSSGPTLSTVSWQLYSNSACTTVLTGTGTSGNGNITTTDSSGGSLEIQAVSGQWIGLTAPASAGGQNFQIWTGTSGNPSFVTSGAGNRTICVTGEASNGLRRITANYAAPATVNTTMTASNGSATYGDTSVTLAATVSPASGPAVNTGTVTFTVGGTSVTSGTVSGGNASATFSLSGVNAGSYSIAATYNAGSGFNASNNSTQSPAPTLTLAKADADCSSIAGYAVTYDASAHTASGTCEGVGGDGTLAGLDLSSTTHTNAGDYSGDAWTFTDVSGNYNDTSGTLDDAIAKAELTVKADPQSKDYDGSAFTAFTRTITGFASGEGESVITGSVTYGGTAVGAVNAGTYTIVPDVSGLSADNYSFTPSNGTLTINKVTLTVRADNKSKVFDGYPFTAFTRTITGFVNSESESVISGTVTYAGTAVGATAVGTYTITPVVSGLSASNYDVTPANGTLTVGAWNAQGYGFYQPVGVVNSIFTAAPNNAPISNPGEFWNTAKGGSTIPLKFNVYAGTVEKTSLSDIKSFQSQKLVCSGGAGDDPVEITITGATSLRYDGTAGQWIQNWKTPTGNGDTCYRAWVTFADGSSIEAFFKLKR